MILLAVDSPLGFGLLGAELRDALDQFDGYGLREREADRALLIVYGVSASLKAATSRSLDG